MYKNAKIYNDGSHYIAIPYSTNKTKRRVKLEEYIIEIVEERLNNNVSKSGIEEVPFFVQVDKNNYVDEETGEVFLGQELPEINKIKIKKRVSLTEIFNEEYLKSSDMTKAVRRKYLIESMEKHFKSSKAIEDFIDKKLEMKKRNLVCRRIRFARKANLHSFNYFVTLTYDSKKHDETTFKSKLSKCLRNFAVRKQWRYMGVWERSKIGRLHFHGMFFIPQEAMPGELIKVKDYSLTTHRMRETTQNTYFNERFGRSDFSELNKSEKRIGSAMSYLMKYIEKTGEKIVYSRGLPTYLMSDIKEDDVVCKIGFEDKKLLLFDDFSCYTDGQYIGKISPTTQNKLKTSN